jgi:hypothetical protein
MDLDAKYIQKAADITMIQDLLARYALALDYPVNGGEDLVRLFAEDGVFTIPELSMVAQGHDEIRAFAEGIHKTVPGNCGELESPDTQGSPAQRHRR